MVFISSPTVPGLLHKGLTEGAAKLRAAIWLEETTGLSFTGKPVAAADPKSDVSRDPRQHPRDAGIGPQASLGRPPVEPRSAGTLEPAGDQSCVRAVREAARSATRSPGRSRTPRIDKGRRGPGQHRAIRRAHCQCRPAEKPQETLLRELTRAADGAAQIAGGACGQTVK